MGNQTRILGDNNFIKEVLQEFDSQKFREDKLTVSELIEELCVRYKVSTHELTSSAKLKKLSHVRGILASLVRGSPNLTLVDLAKILNRDAAGLSHLAIRFDKQCECREGLKMEMEDLKKALFL